MQTPNEETEIQATEIQAAEAKDTQPRSAEPRDAGANGTETTQTAAQDTQPRNTGAGDTGAPNTQPGSAPAYTPRRRRRKKKTFPVPAFLTRLGEDVRWYYDIRLWSPLLLLLVLILALVLPRGKSAEAKAEAAIETTAAAVETTQAVTEAPTEAVVNEEAAALARLADSVGSGRSDNVKTIIMWVAINRSEDQANGYGKTLLEEIARPDQWQGYNENGLYSESTYAIALEVLEIRDSGGLRPLDSDMLWLVLNNDGSVTVRNKFSASGNEEWREKTVK